MNLLKTSFFSSLSTGVKLISYLVISKVLAIYVGPAGFALFGQFQSFVQIVQNFSGSMSNQGITKYIAQFHDNFSERSAIISTGFRLNILGSLLTGLLLILGSQYLSQLIFLNSQFVWTFILLGSTLWLYTLQFFFMAVLNGERDIYRLTVSNMSGSLVTLGLTLLFVYFWGVSGAIASLVVAPSLTLFITLGLCYKAVWFKWTLFTHAFDWGVVKKLSRYILMAFATAVSVPTSHFFIRAYIGHTLSWTSAGYWQGMMRLSDAYLMIFTTTLGIYYLPKFSMLRDDTDIRKEVRHGYTFILPLVIATAFGVYLFRHLLVALLFSNSFLPMTDLFAFQMLGDVLKMGSWLLAYLMVAKSMTRLFILSEIGFCSLHVLFTIVGVHFFGLKGASLAFAITYGLYWILMAYFVLPPRWLLRLKKADRP